MYATITFPPVPRPHTYILITEFLVRLLILIGLCFQPVQLLFYRL